MVRSVRIVFVPLCIAAFVGTGCSPADGNDDHADDESGMSTSGGTGTTQGEEASNDESSGSDSLTSSSTGSGSTTLGTGTTTSTTSATATSASETSAEGSSEESGESGETSGETSDVEFIADVSVAVHDEVNTILVVTWQQLQASDATWIEYSFDDGEWLTSPEVARDEGMQQEVLLGIPGDTEVTFRLHNRSGTTEVQSEEYLGETQSVPEQMPRPTILSYDATLASPNRWMFGSIEDTSGSANNPSYYGGPHWMYIIDRQGRIVWYYADLTVNPTSAFPRITPDGHIAIEKRSFFSAGSYDPTVLHMTLDHALFEHVDAPGLDDCIDFTDDGALLYNTYSNAPGGAALMEMSPDGTAREVWNCDDWANDNNVNGQNVCYSNTVNWNRDDDTVLMSMPYINTVVEIDRESGDLVGQYGEAPGSWEFAPGSYDWSFEFNHFANVSGGRLFVSTHEPGHGGDQSSGSATEDFGVHLFTAFELDRDNERVVEDWVYVVEDDEWARYKGMVMPVENGDGNVIANVGTGGTIWEITPNQEVAFKVLWDGDFTAEQNNKMAGHNILIDDLYALNRLPE